MRHRLTPATDLTGIASPSAPCVPVSSLHATMPNGVASSETSFAFPPPLLSTLLPMLVAMPAPQTVPVADRNKSQPKTATTLNTGAACGASSAREVAGGADSPKSASTRPTIPGKSPCYSWASRTGPCGSLSASDDCCQVNGPYPHKFDPATTPKEKAAFLGWLKSKE